MRTWRRELKADRETTEVNPEEMKSVALHEEVPKEEAAVVTFRALGDRYEDRHLVVGPRRQPKKRTQGNDGSRKKLATGRRMTRRAGVAWRKGRGHTGPTVEQRRKKIGPGSVAKGISTGCMLGNIQSEPPSRVTLTRGDIISV
jgi:hypothetical protein